MILQRPSPNCGPRAPGPVDMLVIHYTGMVSARAAVDRLCDPAAQVSAHYVIDQDGTITQLVAEEQRAWHAGLSFWRGETDINSRSVGIELVNPGHEFGYEPFPEAQIQALIRLGQGIVRRHPIAPRNVVGHSDVAPSRKQDPGELFPWAELAAQGLGIWPQDAAAPPVADMAAALAQWGYDTRDPAAAITAFQRHFRPARVDGAADGETMARLAALVKHSV